MKVRHLRPRDYVRKPWKNGGGTTLEMAVEPRGDGWLWRISVADVERSGPFSDFPGYRRTIMLLEGNGMLLSFEGRPDVRIDRVLEPFEFDGAWKTDCLLLDGPVRDFNLIVDSQRVNAKIDVLAMTDEPSTMALNCDTALIHAIDGAARIELPGMPVVLGRNETLQLDAPAALEATMKAARGRSSLAVIRIDIHS
jgi:environmental stress-induced protein Ves